MKVLIVVCGLPCVGKSTLAEAIGRTRDIPVFSVDPIEAALWRSGIPPSHETGVAAYEVCVALAEERLKLGHGAIVDAVSPIEWARLRWRELAATHDAPMIVIEVVCADTAVHRARVEKRVRNIPGMPEIGWDMVARQQAIYEPWQDDHLVLDALRPAADLTAEALEYLAAATDRPQNGAARSRRQV